MTSHSRILAWRIPGTEEPGGLQALGLQRVGHGGVTDTREAAQAEFSQAGPLGGGGGFFFQVRRSDDDTVNIERLTEKPAFPLVVQKWLW